MTRSFTAVFLCLIFLLPARAIAAQPSTILVVGDSLSAAYGIDVNRGWVSLLQRRLKDKGLDHRVVNASITGDTTRGGLARLPELLSRFHPRIVVLELGGNDGLRGLSLEAMGSNLTRMTELAREAGASVLLLGMRLPANYGQPYGERFHQVYRDVAKRTGAPLVDFFLEGVAETTRLMQSDGLHPAEAGQPRMLDNVWQGLQPLLDHDSLRAEPAAKASG